jgi:hypothetical protein
MPALRFNKQLPPLQDEGDIGRSRYENTEPKNVTSDWFPRWDSPCQVSNDPPADGGATELEICGISGFQCSDESGSRPAELEISFDYEVHFNPEADFENKVLPYLEETMLAHVASAMGVDNCTAALKGNLEQDRRLQSFTEEESARFLGISLEPRDEVDARFPECSGGVSSVAEGSECVPMKGGLTLFVGLTPEERDRSSALPESQELILREAMFEFLAEAMKNNTYVFPGTIQQVTFVGNRTLAPAPISADETNAKNDLGISNLGIILASGFAFIAFLLAAIFLVTSKRAQEVSEVDSSDEQFYERSIKAGALALGDSLALEPQSMKRSNTSFETASVSLSPVKKPKATDTSADEEDDLYGTFVPGPEGIAYIIETETGPEDIVNYAPRHIYFPGQQLPHKVPVVPAINDDEFEDAAFDFSSLRAFKAK